MEQALDLRLNSDRKALARLLPTIDGHNFTLAPRTFIEALEDVATFLRNPEWMVYQWGAFLPIRSTKYGFHLLLSDVVNLGVRLRHLSKFRNFDQLLTGFFNPTQFEDSIFEVEVASYFASLPSINELVFSPSYIVRGRLKKPEFEANGQAGVIAVECKRPHLHVQKANESFRQMVAHFNSVLKKVEWPPHLRLEVEIIGPIYGQLPALVEKVIGIALKLGEVGTKQEFSVDPFKSIVMSRSDPFHITKGKLGSDLMILDQQVATSLFNPDFTILRIVNNRLDSQFSKSIGNRVNEALRQLPMTHHCFIFIGDVPNQIAERVCQRRLWETAYTHVRAFGIIEDGVPKLIYRDSDKEVIKKVFGDCLTN
jgi:hypothetical protein